jgi:hypothetical protein
MASLKTQLSMISTNLNKRISGMISANFWKRGEIQYFDSNIHVRLFSTENTEGTENEINIFFSVCFVNSVVNNYPHQAQSLYLTN